MDLHVSFRLPCDLEPRFRPESALITTRGQVSHLLAYLYILTLLMRKTCKDLSKRSLKDVYIQGLIVNLSPKTFFLTWKIQINNSAVQGLKRRNTTTVDISVPAAQGQRRQYSGCVHRNGVLCTATFVLLPSSWSGLYSAIEKFWYHLPVLYFAIETSCYHFSLLYFVIMRSCHHMICPVFCYRNILLQSSWPCILLRGDPATIFLVLYSVIEKFCYHLPCVVFCYREILLPSSLCCILL